MLNLIKLIMQHGNQAIHDLRKAKPVDTHRGFPVIEEAKYSGRWQEVAEYCPTKAITINPVTLDMGKCIFCGECEKISNGAIKFTNTVKLASEKREGLIITQQSKYINYANEAVKYKNEIHKLFGHSLKLRQVSAAGCNGCEMELAACSNVNFDMGRFGIEFTASPRHADGIVFTGPISKNMAPALFDAYKSVNDPKIVIAVGACAISGGVFAESGQVNREFMRAVKIDLYVPGCPPHPLTFINAVMDLLGIK
jgi:Ni,Fe-hydrogenase III small subunit/NAD-dependent dihydropyrimidine dehydrogenase PreA subunit